MVQKRLDNAKKSTIDSIKTASKTAEATGDLLGNKIADKITSVSKKPAMELHSTELHNNDQTKEEDEE